MNRFRRTLSDDHALPPPLSQGWTGGAPWALLGTVAGTMQVVSQMATMLCWLTLLEQPLKQSAWRGADRVPSVAASAAVRHHRRRLCAAGGRGRARRAQADAHAAGAPGGVRRARHDGAAGAVPSPPALPSTQAREQRLILGFAGRAQESLRIHACLPITQPRFGQSRVRLGAVRIPSLMTVPDLALARILHTDQWPSS